MNNNVLFDGTASLPSYKMLLLIIAAGVILYLILSGKKLKITGIKAAGITLTVDEKESYVREIVILDQPVAKGKIPAKLNPIKVAYTTKMAIQFLNEKFPFQLQIR